MEKNKDYTRYNAEVVLGVVNDALKNCYPENRDTVIDWNYDKYSIFDWWKSNLSKTDLKNMKSFLGTAIKLGFTGYVCFKVGVSGCANGMWAHIEETTDGYSPDGDFIYRSFTPDYVDWDCHVNGESIISPFKSILNVEDIHKNMFLKIMNEVYKRK